MSLTSKELEILQHALGCDQYGQGDGWRNRFVTGPESDDFPTCRILCDQGLMRDFGPQRGMGGMHYFEVLDSGICRMRAESPKPPKVSPGRRRYLDFLQATLA